MTRPRLLLSLFLLGLLTPVSAANRYWDGGSADLGGNGNGVPAGGAGTWNTAIKNWDPGNNLAYAVWNNTANDTAVFGGTAGTVTLDGDLSAGALTFSSAAYTLAGSQTLTLNHTGTTLAGNAVAIDTGLTLKLGVDQTWDAGVSGAGTVDTNGKTLSIGTRKILSVIAGTGSLTFEGNYGSGTPSQLGKSNTYRGITTINGGVYCLEAGALRNAGLPSGFGASFEVAPSNILLNGCTLQSGWSGGGTKNAATNRGLTLIGNVTLYTKNTGTNPTFNGIIAGTGNLQIGGDSGSGAVILGGDNTFTGECRQGGSGVSAPTLKLNHANALRHATLNMNHVNFTVASTPGLAYVIGGLKGTTNLALNSTGTGSVSFGNNNQPNTYAGILSGTVNFIKTGSSIQTLTGVNTYSGTTLINSGTLALSGTGSLASPSITVANDASFDVSGLPGGFNLSSGQSLTGTGRVIGAVTSNGLVAPGLNGTGTLTLEHDFTLTAAGTLRMAPHGASETPALLINGTANLRGTLEVSLANGYVPTVSDTLAVLRADTAINGSFASIDLPGLPSGLDWQVIATANALALKIIAAPTPLSVTPAGHDFGGVLTTTGATAQTTFVVTNTDATILTGTAAVAGLPFTVVSGGSYALAAGESANVVVEFSPTAVGTFTDGLVFASNSGNATHTLTGAGIIPAALEVSPASSNMGGVLHGTTAQATFVVTNTGGLPLTGTATVGEPFAVVSGASFSVNPGAFVNVVVEFSAPTSTRAFSDVVTFTSNAGSTSRMIAASSLSGLPAMPADDTAAYSFNPLPGMPTLSASDKKHLAPLATLKQTFIPRSDAFLTTFNSQDSNGSHAFALNSVSLKLDAYQSTPATFRVAVSRVETDGARTLFFSQDFQQTVYGQTVRTWTFSEAVLLSCDVPYELAVTLVQGGINTYGGGEGGVGLYTSAGDYPDGACSAGGDLWFALAGTSALPVFNNLVTSDHPANAYFFDADPHADSTSHDNLKGKLLDVNGHPEQLNFTCPLSWPPLTFSVADPALATLQTQQRGEGAYAITLNGTAEGETFLFAKAGGTVVAYLKLQSYPQRSMKLSYSYIEYPGESDHALKQASAAVIAYISSVYAKANITIQWTDNGILTHEWDSNGDGNSYTSDYSEVWSPMTAGVIPYQNNFFSNLYLIRYNKDDAYHGGSNGGGTSSGFGLPSNPPRGANVRAHLFGSAQQYGSTLAHELGHNLGLSHTGAGTAPLDNLMDVGRAGDSLWSWQWPIIHNTLGVLFDVPPVVTLTAPGDGSVFAPPGTLNLAAAVVQNRNPITKVEFFADGSTLLGTATAAPYTCAWDNPGGGNHTLTAVVTDNQGMTATSSVVNIAVGTAYEIWSEVIPDPAMRGPAEDPDCDGAANLVEFAYGGNPLYGASRWVAKTAFQNNNPPQICTLTAAVRSGAVFNESPLGPMTAVVDDITCQVEASANLTDWTAPVSEITPAITTGLPAAPTGYIYHTFSIAVPDSGSARGFIRLRATNP